jgi:DNA invertase Pin-like site-specific DNA recombinase
MTDNKINNTTEIMSGKKIGYIRVSSILQNTDRQLQGMTLDKIFVDKKSGATMDRPALNEMLNYIREDDHIYVHSIDRLGRDLLHHKQIVKQITDKGAKITFVKENATFTGNDSPIDILIFTILASYSEFERNLLKERQAEGIVIAKEKQKYVGRKPKLTIDDLEQIKALISMGVPKTKVAKKFNISLQLLYHYIHNNYKLKYHHNLERQNNLK